MKKSIFALPLHVLSIGLLVAACSSDGAARFNKLAKNKGKVAELESCAGKIPSNQMRKAGEGSNTVKVCAYKWKNATLTDAEWAGPGAVSFPAGEGYEVVDVPADREFKREVEKTTETTLVKKKELRRVTVKIQAQIKFHNKSDETYAATVKKLAEGICAPKIEALWRKSNPRLTLQLGFSLPSDEDLSDITTTHPLELVRLKDVKGKASFALALWPFHSQIVLSERAVCEDVCGAGAADLDRQQCLRKCVNAKREPFCQSLAKLVGHWAGVQDPLAATSCQMPEDGRHPLMKSRSAMMGYLKPPGWAKDPDLVSGESSPSGANGSTNGGASSGPVRTYETSVENGDMLLGASPVAVDEAEELDDVALAAGDDEKPVAKTSSQRNSSSSMTSADFWEVARMDAGEIDQVIAPICKMQP